MDRYIPIMIINMILQNYCFGDFKFQVLIAEEKNLTSYRCLNPINRCWLKQMKKFLWKRRRLNIEEGVWMNCLPRASKTPDDQRFHPFLSIDDLKSDKIPPKCRLSYETDYGRSEIPKTEKSWSFVAEMVADGTFSPPPPLSRLNHDTRKLIRDPGMLLEAR